MLNHCEIMGRLTKDPEVRYTASGVAVASFTLASDTGRKTEKGDKVTHFIDCVAWKERAELLSKYVSKGTLIAVEGELTPRIYEDKNGMKHKVTEVNVSRIHFCESKKSDDQKKAVPAAEPGAFMELPTELGEELPFA